MFRWVISFFLLMALIASGLSDSASAAVEWSRQQILKTSGTPVDIATSGDGKYTFILTDAGQVVIYSSQGRTEGTLDVGKNFSGLESSPAGDKLYLIDAASNSVQVFAVNFVVQISEKGSPIKGRVDAPVAIALFSDFQ